MKFDSHYKQGQAPQNAKLVAKFDNGTVVDVERFTSHRLNEAVDLTFAAPAGASSVQLGWAFLQTNNNWFWMIDNVAITEAAPPPIEVQVLSDAKPYVSAGNDLQVRLGGLPAGKQLTITLGEDGTELAVDPAGEDGTVTLTVAIADDHPAGVLALHISGENVVPVTLPISVLGPVVPFDTTERQFWFDGFEDESTWQVDGGWFRSTGSEVVAEYGTDRRQAFTRASGTIMVAEAARTAVDATVTSEPIPVRAGDELELRFDSHYRKRGGAQSGEVRVTFDTDEGLVLKEYADDSEESAQPRLGFTVPAGATTARVSFVFTAEAGAGSWMLDDVHLVRPLPELAMDTEAIAVVDAFSDIQGTYGARFEQVLRGLQSLPQRADVIVANGDLVGQGYQNQYDAYFNAFNSYGGNTYGTSISTMGNHEYYGSGSAEEFKQRFLDVTGMREVGGQGGLWGEVVVDDELPLLWIASEKYEYSERTGAPPFVEMSDEQFGWLQGRLEHWRAENKPVLLFSHHVFRNSVSGTYANFYRNDFDADEARLAALLQANPNVVFITGHTHWHPQWNDWSVEHRFDPSAAHAPTMVNTGAVTSLWGPSGDYGEGVVGGDPSGVRIALYEDRVRLISYGFGANDNTRVYNTIDIALPTDPIKHTFEVKAMHDTDQPNNPNSTVPVKVELLDRDGFNVADRKLVATALSKDGEIIAPVPSPGNSFPGGVFEYRDGQYQLNVRAKGLSSGIWTLHFTVDGEEGEYTTTFRVR